MKKIIALTLASTLMAVSSFSHALNIINYYHDTVRIEAEDCGTYENYKAFPSNNGWFNGDVANNAKYLFVNNIKNGYYSYLSGSNMPKKLCINAFVPGSKNSKEQMITARISTYDSCQINLIDNEDGTGLTFNMHYDCHAQELN